jgi:hypothetical protein
MNTVKRTIAATEWFLVFPGTLFMTALVVRSIQPRQFEPAHSAQRLVDWFSARPHVGLDLFLIALPLAAFVVGCSAIVRGWSRDAELRRAALATVAAIRAHMATLFIAGATVVAGGILAIVAVHMITD